MHFFRLFLISTTFLCTSYIEAKSIDALLVLDMKTDLHGASSKNGDLMNNMMRVISETTGIPLHVTILKGPTATSSNIKDWLLSKKKQPQDILLFYFSGHGMKSTKKGSPWPYLFLSKQKRFIDLSEVMTIIQSMNPRLSITIADCCNSAPTFKAIPFQAKEAAVLNEKKCIRGMKKLFQNTKGYIFATAATPGQFGVATDKGSMFTLSLASSLLQTSVQREPSWNDVFNSTSALCCSLNAQYSHILQIPYVELSVQ